MGNLALNNMQHEEFATEYLFGSSKGNGAQSYANIYNNGEITASCYSGASKLLRRDDIKGFLKVQLEDFKDLTKYRELYNIEMLSKIADEMVNADAGSDINGNPMSPHLQRQTAIRAISEQNKMLGLNNDKTDLTVNGGMNFTFNLIPPTEADAVDAHEIISSMRSVNGEEIEEVEYKDAQDDEF